MAKDPERQYRDSGGGDGSGKSGGRDVAKVDRPRPKPPEPDKSDKKR